MPEKCDILNSLKACVQKKDFHRGTKLHAEILRKGLLGKDFTVATTLINMYAKCGALTHAKNVLDELPVRDVSSWSALIVGYAQQFHGEEALKSFKHMQCEGILPNVVTFIGLLKACGSIGAVDKGEEVHKKVAAHGLIDKDILLGTTIVDMYAKCHALTKAQQVLDELPIRNVVSWNALIAGYAQLGHGEEAVKCYEQMQYEGLAPDKVTFTCTLKACGSIRAAKKGEEIYMKMIKQGLLGEDVVLGTAVMDMFTKCGALAKAARVLDELSVRNVVSWNVLITGYVQHGHGKEALKVFQRVLCDGLDPDIDTYMSVLKACGSIGAVDVGEQVHNEIMRLGLLQKDIALGNTLVDMYAKCGAFIKAEQVLVALPVQDVGSWNGLLAGYVQHGQTEKAFNCYKVMKRDGICPNTVTFICMLKACGNIGAADKGEELHSEISMQGLLNKSIALGNALVDMYAKCAALMKASQLLDELPASDVVSWNALVAGYVQQEQAEEALKCVNQMQHKGVPPDTITYISILKACGNIGAVDRGQQIHHEILKRGFLAKDLVLGTTLVDMYAKCGALTKAAQALDELRVRDVVSWSSLITGYTQHGHGEGALKSFEQMQCEGLSPDQVTFACVLCACGHSCLLREGQLCFENLSTKYEMSTVAEHYTCIIDLFGRMGQFDKVLAVLQKLMFCDHLPLWHALLGVCGECGNVKLGKLAFDMAVQIDRSDPSAYVLMAKIYMCKHGGGYA